MSAVPTTGPCCSTAAASVQLCRLGLLGVLLLASTVAAADGDDPALADLLPPADSVLTRRSAWLRINPMRQPVPPGQIGAMPPGLLTTHWYKPGVPPSLLLVVGVPVGEFGKSGELRWQAPLAPPTAVPGLDSTPQQMRVSLALTATDPYADLRRGLLTRVELSGQTTLSLRPRGGKVMLNLTSRW